jgi:hypothetical protein
MEQPEKASWFNLHTKRFEQPHDDTHSLSLSLSLYLSLVRPRTTKVHKYCVNYGYHFLLAKISQLDLINEL